MRILVCFLFMIISAVNAQAATVTFADYTFETYIISDSPPSGRLYEFQEGRRLVLRVREGAGILDHCQKPNAGQSSGCAYSRWT